MLETAFLLMLVIILLVKLMQNRTNAVKGILPPGSLGLPYVGETFHLALQKVDFFKRRQRLFGTIYKTHLFGSPCIRVTGKKNVRTIMNGENKIVESAYPASVKKLLGPNSLAMSSGLVHKSRRRQLQQFLSTDFLMKHHDSFQELIQKYITKWTSCPSVEIYAECSSLCFDLAAKYLLNMDISGERIKKLKALYHQFTDNLFSIPVDLPGFGFHKAMNAKREIRAILKDVAKSQTNGLNICPSVLEAYGASCESHTDDSKLYDALLELLWNASETMTSATFGICYFLAKHPDALQRLKEETETPKNVEDKPSLSYLECVVREALRTMPPVGGAYRKSTRTFELDGFTVPDNWTIIFGIRDTHENDSVLDPTKFNPDRWNSSERHKIAFMPFGGGARLCPGNKYAMNILKLFTKELGQSCSWSLSIDDPEITQFPRPVPKHKLDASFVLR